MELFHKYQGRSLQYALEVLALLSARERVSRALISMGRDELEKLIAEQHGAELTCQFCDRVYQFTEEELQSLLDEATKK